MSHVESFREIDGERYAWDGRIYAARAEALEKAEIWTRKGFLVRVESFGDSYLVMLRRRVERGLI